MSDRRYSVIFALLLGFMLWGSVAASVLNRHGRKKRTIPC